MADQPWLDRDAVAERLGISVRTLRRMEAEHRIPTRTVGRQVRYDEAAMAALDAACPAKIYEPPRKVRPLPTPTLRPARRKGDASASALFLIDQLLQQGKGAGRAKNKPGSK